MIKINIFFSKVNHAVGIAREAIKYGKCVVIGLQSTGEARTLEQLDREDGELSDFVSTAKGVFQSLVEKHFPAPDRDRINRLLGQINRSEKTQLERIMEEPVGKSSGKIKDLLASGSKRKSSRQEPASKRQKHSMDSDDEDADDLSDNSDQKSDDSDQNSDDDNFNFNNSDSGGSDDYNPFKGNRSSDSDTDPVRIKFFDQIFSIFINF